MPEDIQRPAEGDTVLVDTTAYNIPGRHWCRVTSTRYWSAARYPIKVKLPRYGTGQYDESEIIDLRATTS